MINDHSCRLGWMVNMVDLLVAILDDQMHSIFHAINMLNEKETQKSKKPKMKTTARYMERKQSEIKMNMDEAMKPATQHILCHKIVE